MNLCSNPTTLSRLLDAPGLPVMQIKVSGENSLMYQLKGTWQPCSQTLPTLSNG